MATELDILVIKEKCVPELKKAGVLRSSLFGSFARGEAGPESDVDILIEFPEDKTLFDLIELEENLRSALGRKVDVTTYRSLHHLLRDQILQEQIPIL
jgi:predicted nucleotidyltransferase